MHASAEYLLYVVSSESLSGVSSWKFVASDNSCSGAVNLLGLILPLHYCGLLEYLVNQYPDQNLGCLFEQYPALL